MVTIYKLSPEKITTRRVDPWHYQPNFENQILKVEKIGSTSLRNVIDTDRGVAGGATPLGANYLSQGRVRFYRTSEVDNMHLSGSDAVFISDEDDEKLKRSRLEAGDVLLTITGAKFGKSAVVEEEHLPGNISQHSVRFHPLSGVIDPYFLVSYFESKTGQMAIWREAYGATRPAIDFPSIEALVIPHLTFDAQKYIGEKVRQAERLRVWAKQIESDTHQIFNAAIAWHKSILDVKNYGYVKLTELDGRLDLKYNSPERLAVLRHLKEQRIDPSPLSDMCSISAMIGWKGLTTEFYRESGPWLLRGVEFKKGVINTESLVCVDEFKYNEQPQIHLEEGDIAFSKDGTIGKAIVIPKLGNRLAAGSTIARLRMKRSTNPYYLEFALSHSIVQAQIESFATGIAQPHITQEWIAKLEIPRVDCEERIAEYWKIHHFALNSTKSLTKLANLLVEDLIEGQLTESQLVSAQQALEAGDDSLDRALLERMTAEGIDGEGEPLFDDIDQLYDLLERAKQALDADDTIAEA